MELPSYALWAKLSTMKQYPQAERAIVSAYIVKCCARAATLRVLYFCTSRGLRDLALPAD